MCKKNMKTYMYYVNICKYEYEKNVTKLWCKIMLKTNVEQTKGNEGYYFYLYPYSRFLCVHKVNFFFENLLNWKSIMS